MSPVDIRPALKEDLPWLADLIARANVHPAHQSLYCTATGAGAIRAALRNAEDFPGGWERSFVIGRINGEITAALGCQFDLERTLGWLWGPWVTGKRDEWSAFAPMLLDRLSTLMPSSLRCWEAFLNSENRDGLRFFESEGFHLGLVTHIYVLPREAWQFMGNAAPECQELRAAHEAAFVRLHTETFPAGASTSAEDLLAGRDDEHVIFSAIDGLRLLGYVCASVNRAPREGFIDYFAVRPSARGRGIGARLLQAALQWAFDGRHLPQAALCVSEWRGGARRLYEQAGFALSASGIGAHRHLPPRSGTSKNR